MNKIVFMDCGMPSIFFPAGPVEKGGTCFYGDDKCFPYCPSMCSINNIEIECLNIFRNESVSKIIEIIINEMSEYNNLMLNWNSWGDILPELEDKIISIIKQLSDIGLVQNGFTRNKSFWLKTIGIKNVHIGFSCWDKNEIEELSSIGMVCNPDPNKGEARITINNKEIGYCTQWFFSMDGKKYRPTNCCECYLKKQGCFYYK